MVPRHIGESSPRLVQALDAARGLGYLHSRQIIHRDVKSPNLLVDEFWRVKVAGEGLVWWCYCAGMPSLHSYALCQA